MTTPPSFDEYARRHNIPEGSPTYNIAKHSWDAVLSALGLEATEAQVDAVLEHESHEAPKPGTAQQQ